MPEWGPILLSFKLATVSTLVLLVICFPLACLFAFKPFKYKAVVEAVTTLPIIIPPSVLGFYLLMVLSPKSAIGGFFQDVFHIRLAFTFSGMVIAACIFSLPFMFQPLAAGPWIKASLKPRMPAGNPVSRLLFESSYRTSNRLCLWPW